MATSEIVFNEYLAAELRKRYKSWQAEDIIRCENTETLAGFTAHRPDLVVRDNPMAPVSIETEFSPAATVETDAAARLYQPTGGTIHSAIAVRIPAKYRKFSGKRIASALEDEHTLEYCLIYGDSAATRRRWPSAGYLQGSVTDIAYVIETARVSPITVDQGATILENGANMLAAMLESISIKNQKLRTSLSDSLKQEASLQTYIMASTILVNAFVFQDTIAGTSDDLSSIASLSELGTHPAKNDVIAAWDAVLNVNYWPIFGVAKALLKAVPAPIWGDFMQCCLGIADRLLSLNLGKNPDLIGTIFQRLISDRRFLATFYTAPSSAALMARFVTRASGSGEVDWSNIDIVKSLKVADFACGTGILLCALYSEMRTCMEHAGIDSKSVHQWMVENSLFGCDVIPSATHITATQLSSVFPMVRYNETKVLTMPFGRTNAGDVALGSIDLLEKQSVMPTIATHAVGIRAQSEVQVDAWKAVGGTSVEDQNFDLIVMNPPFTRLTGGGGKSDEISRPLFAAFGATEDDRKAMAERASKLFRETVYHGNAGAGSGFVEIGHRKLKEGGRIGLILPLSAMSGISWKGCRELWRKHYTAVVTVTIAASGSEESAFSADTCVAECMIIGTRSKKPGKDMISVTLYRRPVSPLEGTEIGRRIQSMMADSGIRGIGDGPLGGTPILIGDEKVGEALVTAAGAEPWWTSRIYDHTLAQVAYQLMERRTLALPGVTVPLDGAGPFCLLDDLGKPGPYHLDISGSSSSGGAPRGPFEIKDTTTPQSVNYPVMSAHDEKRERFVEIQANAEGLPRQGVNAKASQILKERFDAIWATRTRLHLSTDTQFNSNALIACLTTRDAVGGRAWPSFVLADKRYEKTVVLWFNSSLGILIFWALSSRSQHGRGSITTSRLREMLCFDPRSLTDADMIAVDTFFDAFKTKSLLDIHECAADPHREELDRFVALHFLHVKPSDLTSVENGLQLLRAKLALEPSISD